MVEQFRDDLAAPWATAADGSTSCPLPDGADDPDAWGPRLDDWVRRHSEPDDLLTGHDRPVTAGLTRLTPDAELQDITRRRHALLEQHIVPPAEALLPLAERELALWERMATSALPDATAGDVLTGQLIGPGGMDD